MQIKDSFFPPSHLCHCGSTRVNTVEIVIILPQVNLFYAVTLQFKTGISFRNVFGLVGAVSSFLPRVYISLPIRLNYYNRPWGYRSWILAQILKTKSLISNRRHCDEIITNINNLDRILDHRAEGRHLSRLPEITNEVILYEFCTLCTVLPSY